jgi:hypothetical protein
MLSKIDREKAVVDLYNKGKNTREIAKELRISPRHIGIILNASRLDHKDIEWTKSYLIDRLKQHLATVIASRKYYDEAYCFKGWKIQTCTTFYYMVLEQLELRRLKLKRRFIGIEIDLGKFHVAKSRLVNVSD